MTNGPIILIQDCDMISNDPRTPYNVLCYFMDTSIRPKLAYVQFPQCFNGLNKNDIYSSEMKRWFHINPKGMDGLLGPDNMGSGCFFMRRAFFGGPSKAFFVQPELPQLSPDHEVNSSIKSKHILELADRLAGCNYEKGTNWGSKVIFNSLLHSRLAYLLWVIKKNELKLLGLSKNVFLSSILDFMLADSE